MAYQGDGGRPMKIARAISAAGGKGRPGKIANAMVGAGQRSVAGAPMVSGAQKAVPMQSAVRPKQNVVQGVRSGGTRATPAVRGTPMRAAGPMVAARKAIPGGRPQRNAAQALRKKAQGMLARGRRGR